ncbi:MAG: sulfatase [Rikenellaceae bacterium]
MRLCALAPTLLMGTTTLVAANERPNIIIFLVDDMGVMDTSLPFLTDRDGNPQRYPLNEWFYTPNMERLAGQGVRFSRFYAQSVSSPTRASIVTGQNSTRHGISTWIKPDENNRGEYGPEGWNWEGLTSRDITLPRLLQKDGYKTILVGKAHFGCATAEGADPKAIGFDVNIAGSAIGHPGSYFGTMDFGAKAKRTTHAVPDLERYHGEDIFLTEALTREAIAQIDIAAEGSDPFFLYMSHYAVHTPFATDKRFVERYKNRGRLKWEEDYASMVEGMDLSLGDIMDHLQKRGIAENTLIIFLGDNGTTHLADQPKSHDGAFPLRGIKACEYEGGVRVPFIAAWGAVDSHNPHQQRLGIKQNSIQQQLGTVMDIMPTILSATGTKLPKKATIDGVDLAPQLRGERNEERSERVLMHYPHEHRGSYFTTFIDAGWKLIYYYNPACPALPQYELYDLEKDPYENTNLATTESEKLFELCKGMSAQLEAEGAQYPQTKDGKILKPVIPTL